MKFLYSVILTLALCTNAQAAHLHLEKEYQDAWCAAQAGSPEVVLPDMARADCLCTEYAVEFDFAPKWAESIGQACYYAECTGLKPGIVLIMEKPGDERFLRRLKVVAARLNIRVWTMTPADLKGGE